MLEGGDPAIFTSDVSTEKVTLLYNVYNFCNFKLCEVTFSSLLACFLSQIV